MIQSLAMPGLRLLPADWDWGLDGQIVLAGVLCAVAASLLGNFLVLRRLSMLGDAISHAVLPGLAAAFFLSNSRDSLPMLVGAVIAGVITALLTEWIRSLGRVEEGASMGVVFTSLFALGLVMIVQAADEVDLHPDCVLYGAIENMTMTSVAGFSIPTPVITLGTVLLINLLFVILFFKELKITSFDPSLATTTGFNASFMHYLLMVLVAVTAVASFETVGNILVVAMFVVPPAAAWLLTDRLWLMILLSAVLAAASAFGGHVAALEVPKWFGYGSTTTTGMMAVVAGLILFLAALFSPSHGILIRLIRRRMLAFSILADDIVALLYRLQERNNETSATIQNLQTILLSDRLSLKCVLYLLIRREQVVPDGQEFRLTDSGTSSAQQLVRSHRLWEQYLASHTAVQPGSLHDKAEKFEHFTTRELRKQLSDATNSPDVDPHGREIPGESVEQDSQTP